MDRDRGEVEGAEGLAASQPPGARNRATGETPTEVIQFPDPVLGDISTSTSTPRRRPDPAAEPALHDALEAAKGVCERAEDELRAARSRLHLIVGFFLGRTAKRAELREAFDRAERAERAWQDTWVPRRAAFHAWCRSAGLCPCGGRTPSGEACPRACESERCDCAGCVLQPEARP